MNLTQLKAFHAVAKQEGFTRAAERLCISQPAVTASVQALEERHGVPLFHRQGRRISLTHAGEHLFSIAEQLFALEEEAADYLAGAKRLQTGRLRLAIGSPYGIAPLVKQFQTRYPGIEIRLLPGNFRNVEEMLLSEQADIAIQTEAPEMKGIVRHPFRTHQLIAFRSRDYAAMVTEKAPSLQQILSEPLILREADSVTRQLFDAHCARHGHQATAAIEAGSRETVLEMVRAGLGIGIVLSGELPPGPEFLTWPLSGQPDAITDFLLHLEQRQNLSLLRAFLSFVE